MIAPIILALIIVSLCIAGTVVILDLRRPRARTAIEMALHRADVGDQIYVLTSEGEGVARVVDKSASSLTVEWENVDLGLLEMVRDEKGRLTR